jgi:hypothetical protein
MYFEVICSGLNEMFIENELTQNTYPATGGFNKILKEIAISFIFLTYP